MPGTNHKCAVGVSGGLDSTVLLAHLVKQNYTCHGVGFHYGSKHNAFENMAAAEVCRHYGVPYTHVDLTGLFGQYPVEASSLLKAGSEIPEGHYEEENMRQTVVPGRNLIILSVLAGFAEAIGADTISIGAHAGDHFIYPDCRPAFMDAAKSAVQLSSDNKVILIVPFLHEKKDGIVRVGHALGVPFEKTRTCYKDQAVACGKCGSCQERLESFALNGMKDPLEYETRTPIVKTAKR
jgi:7-cyano-7-deazaguanine synthase